jgi:ribosomal protein L11
VNFNEQLKQSYRNNIVHPRVTLTIAYNKVSVALIDRPSLSGLAWKNCNMKKGNASAVASAVAMSLSTSVNTIATNEATTDSMVNDVIGMVNDVGANGIANVLGGLNDDFVKDNLRKRT